MGCGGEDGVLADGVEGVMGYTNCCDVETA